MDKLPTPDAPPANDFVARRVLIPNNIGFLSLINGFLSNMLQEWRYQQEGSLTVQETLDYMNQIWYDYVFSDGFMVGSIFPYVNGAVPTNCLPCDGSEYAKADYPNLYAVLDAAFIIDADTFKTPDLRGLTVIGAGTATGSGTSYAVGETGGSEEITLNTTQIPAHTHTDLGHIHSEITAVPAVVNGGLEAPAFVAVAGVGTTGVASANIQNTGGGLAHENRQPFVALKYALVAR